MYVSPDEWETTKHAHQDVEFSPLTLSFSIPIDATDFHLDSVILGSPCDAMDIEDEETASANKILVGMPNMDARKPYMQTSMQHYDRQVFY